MSQIQKILEPHFSTIKEHINADPEFGASASETRCTFTISSSENSSSSIVVGVDHGRAALSTGPAHAGTFGIQARPEDWTAFFSDKPIRPHQSYWGILRVLGHNDGVSITGDQQAFGQHAKIWRLVLERARDAVHGKPAKTSFEEPPEGEEVENDAVVGGYVWIDMVKYGKVKIFHERAGSGAQHVLFLHTAGSDSRQYHSLMNTEILQKKCTMFAFDLPAHGRSSLGSRQSPQSYELDEASYLEVIGKMIKRLGLRNTIICGASMAGHICLAAAIKARELDIHGSIPCEGCEHLQFTQPIYEIKGADLSLLDPERVTGMCAPMSPEYYKRQIWWQYSSQGYKVFAGDLKFYFRGWDGRGRIETIDTAYCPVYMLTGEFDYSCTTDASKATADKVPGARFEAMERLGHFPLTENPKAALPYLLRALEFIQAQRKGI